jgi:hypothetical protein
MAQPLGPCHFRTAPAVSSAVHGAFLDKKLLIWTIWDHYFWRETAEKRLDLNIYRYTRRMMIQTFGQMLPELLGQRLARVDI